MAQIKIEAFIDGPHLDPPDSHTGLICSVFRAPFHDADPVRHVTLVIHDGPSQPVLTQEEHEAEFQRRAKAMINDLIEQRYDDGANWSVTTDAIVIITAKHGLNP